MRLMFASHIMALQAGTVGSAQDIYHYTQVAKTLGHEVLVYGPPDPRSPFSFSLDIKSTDVLIFVFEWTTELRQRDQLDFARFVTKVPRERRIVIDCDGAYNDAISVDGDYNHRDPAACRVWSEVCDSLSDKICQPTVRPLRSNVRPFLFYGFSPTSRGSGDGLVKEYGMVYVGHSKFRWRPMQRVLRAIEPVREEVGRIVLVGHGWDALPPWAVPMRMEDAFYIDQAYLRKLGVEIALPVRFEQVIPLMSKAIFNPVLLRPTFKCLRLVTPRLFETLAASTIPLFSMDPEHIREIYGDCATELLLPVEHPEYRILDMVRRPERYMEIVEGIRRHLAAKHSHVQRFRELIEIVQS
jgi:hypothetical protein